MKRIPSPQDLADKLFENGPPTTEHVATALANRDVDIRDNVRDLSDAFRRLAEMQRDSARRIADRAFLLLAKDPPLEWIDLTEQIPGAHLRQILLWCPATKDYSFGFIRKTETVVLSTDDDVLPPGAPMPEIHAIVDRDDPWRWLKPQRRWTRWMRVEAP